MAYEMIHRNVKTLNELAIKYNDLKNKPKSSKTQKQLKKIKIYMLGILNNIKDLTEKNVK